METGWVISSDSPAVILHTADGGQHWSAQGNSALWAGCSGNDISAVDGNTAWAAVGCTQGGKILHTANGGVDWSMQPLPAGVGLIKNIKGLSRDVAWAATLDGTVLSTTTGGNLWTIVPHPSVPIHQVNRMDALGIPSADVWIADDQGEHLGMIHTPDNGVTWRQEYVPYEIPTIGVHMLSGYSSMVAWSAVWGEGYLFRTVDGGGAWKQVANLGGMGDLDDMCAVSADTVWVVQNHSGASGGTVFHVRLQQDGQSVIDSFNPASNYTYEGLACADDQAVAVVGFRAVGADPTLPAGVIVSTKDGGQTWFNQPVPVNNAHFWKASFVGALR